MPDNSVYGLLPLNSPLKKVNEKDSYINAFELLITQIFPRKTIVFLSNSLIVLNHQSLLVYESYDDNLNIKQQNLIQLTFQSHPFLTPELELNDELQYILYKYLHKFFGNQNCNFDKQIQVIFLIFFISVLTLVYTFFI